MEKAKRYFDAKKIVSELGLRTDIDPCQVLEQNNYVWDTQTRVWTKKDEPAPFLPLIEIRVSTISENFQENIANIIEALNSYFILESQSQVRSWDSLGGQESRIYLNVFRRK